MSTSILQPFCEWSKRTHSWGRAVYWPVFMERNSRWWSELKWCQGKWQVRKNIKANGVSRDGIKLSRGRLTGELCFAIAQVNNNKATMGSWGYSNWLTRREHFYQNNVPLTINCGWFLLFASSLFVILDILHINVCGLSIKNNYHTYT